tara:strand:+ start:929 stop:1726 length:798 start_codon:yes stop_codon:yes gene_type:complete
MFNYLTVKNLTEGVVNIELNRPPANAVHREMYIEIRELFSNLDSHAENARVVVLSAAGKHFCAGNDLDEFATMTPENAEERMWRVREAFFSISECCVPVIGAVQGAALGTGLALAASCDFLVASRDSRFGLPELTVGVMGGARHLGRLVSQPVVRRMYFTGEPLPAEELAQYGAAIIVTEPDELLERATQMATRVSRFSPTAVRVSKRILDEIEWMDLRTGYEFEQGGTVRMSGHKDSKEALAAFAEKRVAVYETRSEDKHWFGA